MLWRGARSGVPLPSTAAFLGAGLFNLIEGLIEHEILSIHHVREVANYRSGDLGFLAAVGVLLALCGAALVRRGGATTPASVR